MFFTYVFALVVLLGVLISVHELGHFLVAKACGVRVLKFSLGFGPPIGFGRFRLSWQRGGTDYVIAWIPLGGFVKMLGENPDEAEDDDVLANPDETLGAKPIWQKLAIVFAGPVMNLLLPVVIFTGLLMLGIDRAAPEVGMVEPGSPAARAGLRAGDRVTAVAGRPAVWWEDVDDAIRAHAGKPLRIAYERDGVAAEQQVELEARSELDEFGAVREVGWAGLGHARRGTMLGIPDPASPAHAAGLRSGDVVRALGGEPVSGWLAFAAAYAAAGPEGTVEIEVARPALGRPATPGDEPPPTLSLAVPATGSTALLGVLPASVLVVDVTADSPAERGGLAAGDLILSLDGEPVGSFASFRDAVQSSEGRTLALGVARAGEVRHLEVTPELAPFDVGLGIEEPRYLVGIRSQDTTLPGATAIDRELNPLVAVPRAVGRTVETTLGIAGGLVRFFTGEVSPRQIAGPIGIAQIAGNALQLGWGYFIQVMVFISINLGILNLLPIPILDGGQALIFSIEAVKRRPLTLRTKERLVQVGLTVLVMLIGLAFWNDISRNWSKVVDWLRDTGL